MKLYRDFFKRTIDISISAVVLLSLAVPLAIIFLWLHWANKGAGALFTQSRPGKDGKIFKIYKFKSMTDDRDANGNLLPDAQRLTSVGRFVRKTSIDELPQLWNVLKGDMSLIGPRPLLTRYLPYYTTREQLRHSIRPGITGWAQVNGRSNTTWDHKLACDVEYAEKISFVFDCKIIWMTLKSVIKRESVGVAPAGDFLDVERKRNGIRNSLLDKK